MNVNEKKSTDRKNQMGNWRNTKTRVGHHGRLLLFRSNRLDTFCTRYKYIYS